MGIRASEFADLAYKWDVFHTRDLEERFLVNILEVGNVDHLPPAHMPDQRM